MIKYIIITILLLPMIAEGQSGKITFFMNGKISEADLRGKSIIEFVDASFRTKIVNQKNQEIYSESNGGYLIHFTTAKGKDLGIMGIIIENDITGEITHLPIGTKNGLKLLNITRNQLYLKGPYLEGGDKKYNLTVTCSIIE